MNISKAVFVHCITLYCSSCKLVEFGICGLPVSGLLSGSDVGGLCAGSDIGGQRAGSDVGGLVSGSDVTGVFVQEVMSGVCCWGSSFRK